MVTEPFPDEERRMILNILMCEQLARPSYTLLKIIARFTGADTVIVANRAYPSRVVES